ncbi:hypothetical protein, partial [Cytobacillus oceanisediminis]|uniref:hypothetical protein n=1 Tax=Cytobacillus oceanisediminis TaxID=665099 RepID=UPI00203FEEE4
PVELDYVLKAFKSPQALYYFYFKIKKTADKHDFHRVCRQSESQPCGLALFFAYNQSACPAAAANLFLCIAVK